MKYRRWNHFRAVLGGYFWKPCPICGQMMGGHEWRPADGKSATITTERRGPFVVSGKGICQDCARAGKGDPAWL